MPGIWEQARHQLSVCILTPLGGGFGSLIHHTFLNSTVALIARTTAAGIHVGMSNARHYAVDLCREQLVENFLAAQPPFDYAFFLDSDVCLPDTALLQLIADSQNSNMPIVVAVIMDKKNPPLKTAPALWTKTDKPQVYNVISLNNPPGLYAIDWSCLAAVLIRRDVLEKMPRPLFVYERGRINKDGGSEDRWFFTKAAEAGFPACADISVRGEHFGIGKVGPDSDVIIWG